MSYQVDGQDLGTLLAGEDLSSSQYFCVKVVADGDVDLCDTLGEKISGIQQGAAESAQSVSFRAVGISKLKLGGTVDEGDVIVTDTAGKGVARTLRSQFGFADALIAGVSDDIIPVIIHNRGYEASQPPLLVPINLAQITGAGDVLTDIVMPFAGKITAVDAYVKIVVTTASDLATLAIDIGATGVTGGAVALTSANCTPLGVKVAGTAVTALNTFAAGAVISVVATSVTAFAEGEVLLAITIE